MGPVSTTPDTMHLMILVSLAAAATAAPQIVPYEHVEIEAEPYIHQEIEAEPYVHIEPELTQEALGVIVRNNQPAVAAPVQFAAPAVQQQFVPAQVAPQQFAAAPVAAGLWSGTCINNLGQGVACRAVEQPQVAAPVVAATRQQFVPQQQFVGQQFFGQVAPQQFAATAAPAPAVQAAFNGVCVNSVGAVVPCSQ